MTGAAEAQRLADVYLMEVHIYRNKTDAFAGNSFTVTIKIKEKVPLQPGSESWTYREIWWDWKIGSVPYYDLRYLQKYTLELIDSFAETYRKERFGY